MWMGKIWSRQAIEHNANPNCHSNDKSTNQSDHGHNRICAIGKTKNCCKFHLSKWTKYLKIFARNNNGRCIVLNALISYVQTLSTFSKKKWLFIFSHLCSHWFDSICYHCYTIVTVSFWIEQKRQKEKTCKAYSIWHIKEWDRQIDASMYVCGSFMEIFNNFVDVMCAEWIYRKLTSFIRLLLQLSH